MKTFVLVMPFDAAFGFVMQYLQSEVSRLTVLEIIPDMTVLAYEQKKLIVRETVEGIACGLFQASLQDGMFRHWKEYLQPDDSLTPKRAPEVAG